MFDALVEELSERYGLGDRGRDLFGLLVAYIHNDRRGGFPGFIEGFREQGHGELVAAWIGAPDSERTLNAGDVNMVFGQGLLGDWGNRLGVSRATVAAAIAGVLPRLVAELTPGGRVPGGVVPLAPVRTAVEAASTEPAARAFDARSENLGRTDYATVRAAPDAFGLGGVVPGEERRMLSETHDAAPTIPDLAAVDASLADAALRTPVAARQAHETREALDPAEQRVADMVAAFGGGKGATPAGGTRPDQKPDYWRPAVHPPQRKRGRRWPWLLAVLLAIGAIKAYAWSIGLLDPYIERVNAQLRPYGIYIPESGAR